MKPSLVMPALNFTETMNSVPARVARRAFVKQFPGSKVVRTKKQSVWTSDDGSQLVCVGNKQFFVG